jgi:hypothetical protein
MILPKIEGYNNILQNSFYFAADSMYFNLYGKALIKSLKKHASWANIHAHMFNPTETDLTWLQQNNVTCSYEYVDEKIEEIKTYYACVRFIRIPEIFSNNTRIISLDADGIAVRPIAKEKFLSDTDYSKVLWREKQKQSLASSIIYGPDDFRFRYAGILKQHFLKDDFKWFLDQNVLDQMIKNNEVKTFTERDWGNSKIGKQTLIWSAKGNKKSNNEFQCLISSYTEN